MKNSLIFTRISNADINILMPIENACHSHPWNEKTFSSCIGNRYFGEKLVEPLDDTENVIGFYVGELVIDEATLMDICVEPSAQGKGYGKQLLNQFIQHAKSKGALKIWLEVRAKNISAQMMYINAGFVEISRRTGYYPSSSGFGYEDAIVMSLSL
ncbi:ribosomal protein S18-alanine N-acetyltransferase [Colwellia sp. E150_009]